jgi:hypothetical protein
LMKGVCSACNFAEFKQKIKSIGQKESENWWLCWMVRRNDGRYDVVVLVVVERCGLYRSWIEAQIRNELITVTWAPHLYTDIGFKNLHEMIRVGDLANILGSPAGATHKIDQIIVWDIRGSISTVYIWTNFPYKLPFNMIYL